MKELLFTPVETGFPFRLNPGKTSIALLGSCFTENLAKLLDCAGVKVASNPGGILYNPVSLAQSLGRSAEDLPFAEKDFFEYNGLFHSMELHGSFSGKTLSGTLARAEESRLHFRDFLKRAELLVVTFGTAVVFETENGIAGNCHKLPGERFSRRLLSYGETLCTMENIAETMQRFSPDCRIVFTVSPVRHHPGDPVLNSRSKSLLVSAAQECCEKRGNLFYYPAFEILNDELRDYRFYASDLVHPSETAVRIIVSRFMESILEKGSLLAEEAYRKMASDHHRPIYAEDV